MTSISLTGSGSGLVLTASWQDAAPATLTLRAPGQDGLATTERPLVEVLTSGHGRDWAGPRYIPTSIGQRLRHRSHNVTSAGNWQTLSLTQADASTGLEVTSHLSIHHEHLAVRSWTSVHNGGQIGRAHV